MNKKYMSMQEIQKVSLSILKNITDIMDREGFNYVLAYGTLIGAIRHNGFIPWDDDVDIMMPRPDYDKFIQYAVKHKEEFGYIEVMNMQTTHKYPYMITRMCDNRYEIDVDNEEKCGMGIFVDIYPLDGIGNTLEEANAIFKKSIKYPSCIFLSTRKYYHFGMTKGWKKRILKFPAFVYTHLMGKNFFVKKLNALLSNLDYEHSKYIGCVAWDTYPLVFEKKWIEERIKAEFGQEEFYIPKEYDRMLRSIYGDYMQLPPEKDRVYHHLYKAYLKS